MQIRIFFQYLLLVMFFTNSINSQDYFLENNGPYDSSISSPEEFLGYEIGFQHTRHDLIVDSLNSMGVKIIFISDGDVLGVISVADPKSNIDIYNSIM